MSLNLGSLGMEDASFDFGGSYIMALDCGTTSVLATIVDEYGCIVAQARRSVKTSFPRPGWVEQDPMAVLASQIAVMMEVQFNSPSSYILLFNILIGHNKVLLGRTSIFHGRLQKDVELLCMGVYTGLEIFFCVQIVRAVCPKTHLIYSGRP